MPLRRCEPGLRLTLMAVLLSSLSGACAANQPATTAPGDDAAAAAKGKLPHVQVDVTKRQVRVECQMLGIEAPLEFLCVATGTNEHESVLRSPAKPSHIHLGLVMLGLDPGQPVHYSDAAKKWFPPSGPPLNISVEFTDKDGKLQTMPASRLMRSVHDKKPQPAHTWIFAGSRIMPDGSYAADVTGYTVSVVNFELSLIDIPDLASSANETLEWEIDKSIAPAAGSAVTMIIEPVAGAAATQSAPKAERAPKSESAQSGESPRSEVDINQLRQRWQQAVAPHRGEMREAAQAHYDVMLQLRREQQKLVDQADRIQRLIDDLERQYQEMTTPQPQLPAAATQPASEGGS